MVAVCNFVSYVAAVLDLMQLLLTVSELFGDDYITNIMLPVFLMAVGDKADFTFIPNRIQSRIKGFKSDF